MKNIYVISDKDQYANLIDNNSSEHTQSVFFHHIPAFEEFESSTSNDVDGILVGCVRSKSVRDLSELQFIRESYKNLQVIALFDVDENYHQAKVALRGVISTSLEESAQSSREGSISSDAVNALSQLSENVPDLSVLTSRQLDVLELIRKGESNKEIAKHLGLSDGTIKVHCLSIFRALGVGNRTQAAMLANQALQARGSDRISPAFNQKIK